MDYNWLLTTIAQSSAALVGISSGFLILRIRILNSSRSDLNNDTANMDLPCPQLVAILYEAFKRRL